MLSVSGVCEKNMPIAKEKEKTEKEEVSE